MLENMLKILFVVLVLNVLEYSFTNVVCSHTSPNKCNSDNPDMYLNSLQLIARYGYPAESHIITTQDGYLLNVHRIPYSKNNSTTRRQPIYLQHGLLGSSSNFLLSQENSLAFMLSDAGYDVWLGNARGNFYSTAHVKYTIKDNEYWDFSWHEMGIYDLPAVFAFIEKTTNTSRETIYIGHSMGTTMYFVYSSTFGESQLAKAMVALAPVTFMTHLKSPVRYFSPWVNDIEWLAKHFGVNDFLPSNKIMHFLEQVACDETDFQLNICENILFLICGFEKQEFNLTLLPTVLNHGQEGSSTKTVLHYLQEIATKGNFQEYDYGSDENMKRYGTTTPPLYNLTNIQVPIYLMASIDDKLTGIKDVDKLHGILNNTSTEYVIPLDIFSHIDFLWGKDAVNVVYEPLLKFINKFT